MKIRSFFLFTMVLTTHRSLPIDVTVFLVLEIIIVPDVYSMTNVRASTSDDYYPISGGIKMLFQSVRMQEFVSHRKEVKKNSRNNKKDGKLIV